MYQTTVNINDHCTFSVKRAESEGDNSIWIRDNLHSLVMSLSVAEFEQLYAEMIKERQAMEAEARGLAA